MENTPASPESAATPPATTRLRRLGRSILAGVTNYTGMSLVVAGIASGGLGVAALGIGAGSAFLYGSRELMRNRFEPDASPLDLKKRSLGKRLARGAIFLGSSFAAYLSVNLLASALWPRAIFEHGISIASRIALGGIALGGATVSGIGLENSYEDNPFHLIHETTDPLQQELEDSPLDFALAD